MNTQILAAPVPSGQPITAAAPQQMLDTLGRLFTDRYSAVGIRLTADDLTSLQPLTMLATGDVNREAWAALTAMIRRHGVVHLWPAHEYKEEVG